MIKKITDWLKEYAMLESFMEHFLVILIAFLLYLFVRKIFFRSIFKLIKRSKNNYDNILIEHIQMNKVALIPSLTLLYYYTLTLSKSIALIQDLLFVLIAFFILRTLSASLNALNDIYNGVKDEKSKPIKGYIQIFQIFLYIVVSIIVIGTLVEQSPLTILSGVGAFTAVLLLIFRDTILSLVASVQITTNDLLHVGDWIEMPNYGVDGDVMDIALHTVKIRNFDKTITTVPTHKFIEVSFKNWRGMIQNGGRRIKRSIYIDMDSIHHYTKDEIEKLKANLILKEYLEKKESELEKYNKDPKNQSELGQRRLTNIGTFRNYLINYLSTHINIRSDMTLMVRQLTPSTKGLPIEVYCFANTTSWEKYEEIQADIFDHIFAITSVFKLKIFQEMRHI